jgi:hypothetical protein
LGLKMGKFAIVGNGRNVWDLGGLEALQSLWDKVS